MNHAHTLQLLAESTERAISIQADYLNACADRSPFTNHSAFQYEINELRRNWSVEARIISRLADSMMGIDTY